MVNICVHFYRAFVQILSDLSLLWLGVVFDVTHKLITCFLLGKRNIKTTSFISVISRQGQISRLGQMLNSNANFQSRTVLRGSSLIDYKSKFITRIFAQVAWITVHFNFKKVPKLNSLTQLLQEISSTILNINHVLNI